MEVTFIQIEKPEEKQIGEYVHVCLCACVYMCMHVMMTVCTCVSRQVCMCELMAVWEGEYELWLKASIKQIQSWE